MGWVLRPEDVADSLRGEIGGKAGNLLHLTRAGYPVPPWLAVSAGAFDTVLADAGGAAKVRARLAGIDYRDAAALETAAADLRKGIAVAGTAFDWEALLAGCRSAFAPDDFCAVRSSATVEDSRVASFAGQFESFLFVRGDKALRNAIEGCWRSAFSARVLAYQHARGLDPATVRVAVVVQRMVAARASGVLFTRDAATGRAGRIAISANLGLGVSVVGGTTACDSFFVDRRTRAVSSQIAVKRSRDVLAGSGGGLTTEPIPEAEQSKPCLSGEEIERLAGIGLAIERDLGEPQDIEWAVDGAGIWILQTRPITTPPAAAEQPVLWDNSNIVESYPGITTPLTFSFAREAYSTVYPQALAAFGVSSRVLRRNRAVFDTMIGLARGRIYYNLNSWYTALALLPGFRFTARFMELMMGLRDPQAREVVRAATPPPESASAGAAGLAYLLLRTTFETAVSPRRNREFLRDVEAICGPAEREDFSALSPTALVDRYARLRETLLGNWKPPILNDTISMLFYGVLRRMLAGLAGEDGLQADLLAGLPGLLTTAPARRLAEMASLVLAEPDLRALFESRDDASLADAVLLGGAAPELARAAREYLDEFGCRSPGELKLEEPSLRAEPAPLFASIRAYVSHNLTDVDTQQAEGLARYRAALRLVKSKLGWVFGLPSPRYLLLRLVLHRARLHLRDRENMRFARARVFGVARDLFLALGRHLAAMDEIDEERDVFYLEAGELLGFVNGSGTTADLRGLARLRRAEFDRYQSDPPPRFETRGAAFHDMKDAAGLPPAEDGAAGVLRGLGCQPGRVRGPVHVVEEPAKASIKPGEIVVARQTDPGWVIVFPLAAGLLVERGGPLSHAAIVARELGIPAVVGIPDLLERLHDGDWVELDGAAGTVRKLDGVRAAKGG